MCCGYKSIVFLWHTERYLVCFVSIEDTGLYEMMGFFHKLLKHYKRLPKCVLRIPRNSILRVHLQRTKHYRCLDFSCCGFFCFLNSSRLRPFCGHLQWGSHLEIKPNGFCAQTIKEYISTFICDDIIKTVWYVGVWIRFSIPQNMGIQTTVKMLVFVLFSTNLQLLCFSLFDKHAVSK